MTEGEIDKATVAFAGTLELLKPYIAERYPQLVAEG
jgi:hypothetical protein